MEEVWKDIEGFVGLYQVSNIGRVRSVDRVVYHTSSGFTQLKGKTLKPGLASNGYLTVVLYKEYKKRSYPVHHLVANAFVLRGPHSRRFVNHIDHNKVNNHSGNLEFVSFRENVTHSVMLRKQKPMGISWDKKNKRWRVSINIDKTKIRLGSFVDKDDAARAYLQALKDHNIENRYAQSK